MYCTINMHIEDTYINNAKPEEVMSKLFCHYMKVTQDTMAKQISI